MRDDARFDKIIAAAQTENLAVTITFDVKRTVDPKL